MSTRTFTSVSITLSPVPNELFDQRARLLGYIWSIMATSKAHRQSSFAMLERVFNPAFRHGQLAVFFNSVSEPVAYVVWAFLAPDVEEQIIGGKDFDLHLSEWNEGDQLWIVDCAVLPGYFPLLLKDHLRTMFSASSSARYCRTRGARRICKELDAYVLDRMLALLCPEVRQPHTT